jgi:predicted acyl esterase
MLVDAQWDQEEIYGAPHVFAAMKPHDTAGDKVYMVMGPWFHHQERLDGSAIGDIRWGVDTANVFRMQMLRPFLDHFLKDGNPPARLYPVVAYESGTNHWDTLPKWPAACPMPSCHFVNSKLYLQPNGMLDWKHSGEAQPGYSTYVSDPAKPVPFLPRPVHLEGEDGERAWQSWLVSDQRPAASRTDVLTYERFRGETDRRVSGRDRPGAETRRLCINGDRRYFPRALPAGAGQAKPYSGRAEAELQLQPTGREPCLFEGAPDHGANSVELVSAL